MIPSFGSSRRSSSAGSQGAGPRAATQPVAGSRHVIIGFGVSVSHRGSKFFRPETTGRIFTSEPRASVVSRDLTVTFSRLIPCDNVSSHQKQQDGRTSWRTGSQAVLTAAAFMESSVRPCVHQSDRKRHNPTASELQLRLPAETPLMSTRPFDDPESPDRKRGRGPAVCLWF